MEKGSDHDRVCRTDWYHLTDTDGVRSRHLNEYGSLAILLVEF